MKPPHSGHFHAVRFYESSDALSNIVADFIAEGFAQNLPAVVIATPEHVALIERQLEAKAFDLARLRQQDDFLVTDAARQLAKFMVDGMPDPRRFRAATIPLVERACRGRQNCVVRAYGEMVDVLWRAGQTIAAVKLEMLWNELAQTEDFALLCGYSMGHFYKDASVPDEIFREHTHVVSASGEAEAIR